MIGNNEKKYFDDLFNRDGYVLNFSTATFNEFTKNSIGIALCEEYGLSKGKSLKKFVDEGNHTQVVKLLDNLLEYYIIYCADEIENNRKNSQGMHYKPLYKKCREIINREKENLNENLEITEDIKQYMSSEYLDQQIDLVRKMYDENPTEAIGKSKEILETVCKTILESHGETFSKSVSMSELIKSTLKILDIEKSTEKIDTDANKILKKILGSLNGMYSGIVELRNYYGSGHGRSASFIGLSKRHAKLAVGLSFTLARYLLETIEEKDKGKEW